MSTCQNLLDITQWVAASARLVGIIDDVEDMTPEELQAKHQEERLLQPPSPHEINQVVRLLNELGASRTFSIAAGILERVAAELALDMKALQYSSVQGASTVLFGAGVLMSPYQFVVTELSESEAE